MNFKEYDAFINNHKNDMLHFIIYYHLKCTEELNKYNREQQKELIEFAYKCYLKDEHNVDLGLICDKIMVNVPLILTEKLNKWGLLEACYDEQY